MTVVAAAVADGDDDATLGDPNVPD